MTSHCARAVVVPLMIVALGAASVSAQTTADIRGKVADETDAALPGVAVTATSPALLVPQLVSVTDTEGNYAFPALPIGTYRLVFEFSGFQRLVRDEIVLRVGFTATINIALKVGAVEESITVTGASPVVDVTATTPSTSLNAQVLTEVIPATRTLQDFLATTAGVQPGGRSDLGGGTPSGGSYSSVYGISGQITNLIEGVSTRQGAGAPGTGPDLASLEELQVVAIAGSAEQALPGVAVNMIAKSGGNAYHGKYRSLRTALALPERQHQRRAQGPGNPALRRTSKQLRNHRRSRRTPRARSLVVLRRAAAAACGSQLAGLPRVGGTRRHLPDARRCGRRRRCPTWTTRRSRPRSRRHKSTRSSGSTRGTACTIPKGSPVEPFRTRTRRPTTTASRNSRESCRRCLRRASSSAPRSASTATTTPGTRRRPSSTTSPPPSTTRRR